MIKVCHMTSVHNSGDIRIFHKECASLANEGYEVYLVARGSSYDKNGVHIVGIGDVTGGRINRMLNVTKQVYQKALEIDADIYHFHDPELLPFGLNLKKKGKKVIFDSHEKYTEQLQNKPYLPHWISVNVAKIYEIYEKYVIKRIDAVIFPCTINGINPFKGKCNYTELLNNTPLLNEMYSKYAENSDIKIPTACYVGRITSDRGITQIVMACNNTNISLLLCGEISSVEYRDELEKLDKNKIGHFLGQLDRQEIIDTLQKSSIGLVTELNVGQNNTTDNLPTKAYEYMSMGLPVIISKYPYVEYILKKYGFGISVDPENVDEISKAIKYLLDNPDEAKRMGENGRRAVKEEFNWSIEEKKLFKLYEDVLKD